MLREYVFYTIQSAFFLETLKRVQGGASRIGHPELVSGSLCTIVLQLAVPISHAD